MIMADEKNTSEVQDPVAIADVLQTTPKQYPISASSGSVDKVMAQKADVAEREAKNAQLLASRTNETMAPIDEMQKNKIFGTQQILDDIGKQQQKPFKPPQETVADFAELGGLVAVVGAMLGTSGKMSANNVIGAMTGIMDGYKKGRTDLVASSYKEFEANMKRLQAQSQNATAQLDNYTKLVAVDRDAATRVLAEYKAELNKGVAADKVLADSGFDAIKTKSQIAQLAIKQKELDQKINKDVVDSMVNHQMKGQDGKLYYVDPRDMKTKEVPNQMSPVPKGGKTDSMMGVGAKATLAEIVGADVARNTPDKTAEAIVGKVNAGVAISQLLDLSKDPEVKFGELPKSMEGFQNWLKRNFKEGVEATPEQSTQLYDAYAKANGLSTSDKNAVFQKMSIFAALDSERQATGRMAVGYFRALTPLLDPKMQSRESFQTIQEERLNSLQRNSYLSPDQWKMGIDTQKAKAPPLNFEKQAATSKNAPIISKGSPEYDKAIAWIAAHPNDSRIPAIKKKLGVE